MAISQRLALTVAAGLWLLLSGCVPSLNPILEVSQQQAAPGLEGSWRAAEGDQITFSTGNSVGAYRAVFVDKSDRAFVFNAATTQIGGQMYLDLIPAATGLPQSEFLDLHLSTWHSFARLTIDGDSLTLGFADPLWLRQHLAASPDAIATIEDDRLRLIAPTETLRAFIARQADQMFGVQVRLIRQP